VGIIGVAYLIGMSTYTLGSIVVGLLTDILVSEYSLCGEWKRYNNLIVDLVDSISRDLKNGELINVHKIVRTIHLRVFS